MGRIYISKFFSVTSFEVLIFRFWRTYENLNCQTPDILDGVIDTHIQLDIPPDVWILLRVNNRSLIFKLSYA
jgi:hypothetical protein